MSHQRARLARIVLAGAAGGWAGLAFAPAFGGFPGPGRFALATSAVVLMATAVALLTAFVPRLPPAVTAAAGAVGIAAAALVFSGTGVDVVHGPWRLLTAALPADASGAALGAVVMLAGWLALAATLLASYARNPVLPLLVSGLGLVTALAVTASAAPLPAWYAPVGVALAVGLAMTGRAPSPGSTTVDGRGRGGGMRRVVPPAVVATLAVLAAVLLGPTAPGIDRRPPADARDLVAGAIQPRSGVSPLQQYLALRDGTLPLKVTGSVSRAGSALRLATLVHFDGAYWTVAGDYRHAGVRLPAGRDQPSGGSTITERVRVEAGTLDWLLTAGRASRVSVPDLGVDEATGDLAVPAGTVPPEEYTASSTVSDVDLAGLLAARPARAAEPLRPPLPPALGSFVDAVTADRPDGLEQLLALYRTLRGSGQFRYDEAEEVAGGHGYFQLLRLLQTRRGTSEQYASLYAVLARALGYDARVVVGFLPTYQENAFVAVGRDVAAWAEVRFDGIGWVTVDPSPRSNPIGTRADARPAAAAGADASGPMDEVPDAAVPVVGESAATPPRQSLPPDRSVPVALIAAAVTIGVGLLAVPVAKAVRRHRRRRSPAIRRSVWGAWWETTELLRTIGVAARPSHTTGEVVGLSPDALDVGALASLVDRVGFAPEPPADAERAAAWANADRIRRRVRAGMSPPRRLLHHLDPRPLFRQIRAPQR